MPKIAVDNYLSNVRRALENNGYDVVSLDSGNIPACDCYVISGVDRNLMGISTTSADVPVISIQGLSETEILQQVKRVTD